MLILFALDESHQSLSGLCCVCFPHASPSHFTGRPLFLCECSWLHPCSLFHFLTTSRVGSSEQLSVSPRVRDQSEAPISPTATTVDAAGQKEGSGLTSCHTDPASRGQNLGPWATVSHCVSFQPSHSHRAAGEGEGGRPHGEKKSTQRPRDLFFCDVDNDRYV